jgi:spore maturation protein B
MIQNIVNLISIWAIPVFLIGIPLYGAVRGVKVYESFVEGAKEGFQIAVRIIPYLVAILVAVGMLRGAGGIDLLVKWVDPVLARIGIPAEIVPLGIMRALSGSGSLGIVTELVKTHGPDSFIARLAASIYGSTETTFYVLAVYFGAVGIKKPRHAVLAGLIADLASLIAAVVVCRLVFTP